MKTGFPKRLNCKISNVYVLNGDAALLNMYPYCTIQPKDGYYWVIVSYRRAQISLLNRVVYLLSRLLPNHTWQAVAYSCE